MPVRQFLCNLQTPMSIHRGFYKKKTMYDNQKNLFRHWPLMQNFSIAYLQIHVRFKPKAQQSGVRLTALWPLSAFLSITV
jgi:hypothetical protein